MSSIKFEPLAGTKIDDAIGEAMCMAEITRVPVDLTFNGTEVRVECSHVDQVKRIWESQRGTNYAPSPGAKIVETWGAGEGGPPPPQSGQGGSGGSPRSPYMNARCQCGEVLLTATEHSVTDNRGTRIHGAGSCWWAGGGPKP
jgi:hypothetical protein